MNTSPDEPAVIARLRSALDEVTAAAPAHPLSIAPNQRGVNVGRVLAIAAAAILVVGGVAAVVINRNNTPSASPSDNTPSTPTPPTPTEPTLIRSVVPWYTLASQDMVPGVISSLPNLLQNALGDETSMAWARNGDPADALFLLRSGRGSPDMAPADTSLAGYQMIGDQVLAVSSYGLNALEQADLLEQVQPGSGLPWVLPADGWVLLGLGAAVDGSTTAQTYSGTAGGAVTITVGPLFNQFLTLATVGSIEPVTVAGHDGWKATGESGVYLVWPAADSGQWATMTISGDLADRTDGLLAAVGEVEGEPSPVVETVPVPRVVRYQGVVGLIDSGSGPMIAFGFLDSLPPLGGDIPLAGFDWAMIDGERTVNGTTWFDGPVLVTGTWDGTTFSLTEPAFASDAVEWPVGPTYGEVTPGCTDRDMAPALEFLTGLDDRVLHVISSSDDSWDGRCGVQVHAAFDSPELRVALAPLGDQVTLTVVFVDVTD